MVGADIEAGVLHRANSTNSFRSRKKITTDRPMVNNALKFLQLCPGKVEESCLELRCIQGKYKFASYCWPWHYGRATCITQNYFREVLKT